MIIKHFLVLSMTIFVISCQSKLDYSSKDMIYVIDYEKENFALIPVKFKTLTEIRSMNGEIAQFYVDCSIGNAENCKKPVIDLHFDGKAFLANDMHSLSMLTIYYHMEQFLIKLKTEGFISNFPDFKILYEFDASVSLQSHNGAPIKKRELENAAYVLGENMFLFYKTSRREKIPMKLNPFVIAHELGHWLIDTYNDKLQQKNYRFIHEGGADFIAYHLTGIQHGVILTLDGEENRNIPVNFKWNQISGEASPYYFGSVIASYLYDISKLSGSSSYKTLKYFLDDFIAPAELNTFYLQSISEPSVSLRVRGFNVSLSSSRLPVEVQALAVKWFQ